MRKKESTRHASMLLVYPMLFPFFSVPSLSSPRIIHCSSSRDSSRAVTSVTSCRTLPRARLSLKIRVRTLGKLNFNSARSTSRSRETLASLHSIYSRNNQSFSLTEEFGVLEADLMRYNPVLILEY